LSKYVAKGSSFSADSEVLWSYYEAFHRSRDTNSFGEKSDVPEDSPRYVFVGIVSHLIHNARQGDSEAFDLLCKVEDALLDRIRRREQV
jgi:hypothetical protein